MKPECEICRGRGFVPLPVYRHASVDHNVDHLEATARDYRCPECTPTVDENRIVVVANILRVDQVDDPAFMRNVERTAAAGLFSKIVDGGYVKFELGPLDAQHWRRPLVASIGVVSKDAVASIESRARAAGLVIASGLVADAVEQIENWGDHGLPAEIPKSVARMIVHDALKRYRSA